MSLLILHACMVGLGGLFQSASIFLFPVRFPRSQRYRYMAQRVKGWPREDRFSRRKLNHSRKGLGFSARKYTFWMSAG